LIPKNKTMNRSLDTSVTVEIDDLASDTATFINQHLKRSCAESLGALDFFYNDQKHIRDLCTIRNLPPQPYLRAYGDAIMQQVKKRKLAYENQN